MRPRLGFLIVVTALLVSSCAESSSAGTDWTQQSSASSGGGMDAMIAAARREGTLNLPGGAYGPGFRNDIAGFQARYGIQVTIRNEAATDASQIDDLARLGGSEDALDVVNLSPWVADANTGLLAPYLVFYWLQMPTALKNPMAYWYDGCGGVMAIGYDSSKVPAVTGPQDLTRRAYAGSVALAGDPTSNDGALTAVMMSSLASGGSAGDVAPGVDFFHRLKVAGNLVAWSSGEMPSVVLDWDFDQRGYAATRSGWRWTIPAGAAIAGYRAEAISRRAPHPAAARLWEEYLFSDTGQNDCLRDGAHPARMDAMRASGVLDLAAAAALDPMPRDVVVPTPAQMAAAHTYVQSRWAGATG